MQDGILFDDILVTHDEADAQKYRDKTWKPKFDAEKQREAMEDKENDIINVNRPPRNMKVSFPQRNLREYINMKPFEV
jgi:hypothetical protein